MSLIADPSVVEQEGWPQRLYTFFDFSDQRAFIVAAGLSVIVLLTASRLFAILMEYLQARLSWGIYNRTSTRMLRYYLAQPYRYFLSHNTADIRTHVLNELNQLVDGYLNPIITLVISGITALVIILVLLAVDAGVAIGAAVVLGGAYLLIYKTRKRPLAELGKVRYRAQISRQRALEELLLGIKTVKTYGSEGSFMHRYERDTATLSRIHPRLIFLYRTPRHVLEILAYCGIIGLTLMLYLRSGNLARVLPTLTLFAVAGYRLLPTLQHIFGAVATMRYNEGVLDKLYDDLVAALTLQQEAPRQQLPLPFEREIALDRIDFHFPAMATPLFTDLSLRIRKGQVVAFVGQTGSGKTTLVDLITGLLHPTSGSITVDGKPLDRSTIDDWRRKLAYVPQDVFLYDGTLRDNVTFGITAPTSDADILTILEMVDLKAFVESPQTQGLETVLGENGVRLSGGQRQRVGLARALLRQPEVLVLDEATSALDTITEKAIIQAIEQLPETLTVLIIAHRLSTVRYADCIHLLEAGRLVASGDFEALRDRNERFRRMTEM